MRPPHRWRRRNGLRPDDFDHILTSFPVFARKRPAFHAYLLARLADWRAEGDRIATNSENVP